MNLLAYVQFKDPTKKNQKFNVEDIASHMAAHKLVADQIFGVARVLFIPAVPLTPKLKDINGFDPNI